VNTLGTSTGHYLAHNTGLGFVASTVVITAMLAAIAAAHYLTPISGTALFWTVYALTGPFGANVGNTFSKGHDRVDLARPTGGQHGPPGTAYILRKLSRRPADR
jgi:uncharacterized membrane-anchored protein